MASPSSSRPRAHRAGAEWRIGGNPCTDRRLKLVRGMCGGEGDGESGGAWRRGGLGNWKGGRRRGEREREEEGAL